MANHKIFRADIYYLSAFGDSIEQEHSMSAFTYYIADLSTEMIEEVSDWLTELNASFEVHQGIAGLLCEGLVLLII